MHLPPASPPAKSESAVVIQYFCVSVSDGACECSNSRVASCGHKQVQTKGYNCGTFAYSYIRIEIRMHVIYLLL